MPGYEDWDMWLNMSINGAVPAYLNDVGLIYNMKGNGLGNKARENHDILYANMILNNSRAFQNNSTLIKWASQQLAAQNLNSRS